jgi:hypothetical protein
MKPTGFLISLALVWVAPTPSLGAADFAKDIRPLVERHCLKCHGGDETEAGVDFSRHETMTDVLRDRTMWMDALEQIQSGDMPPNKKAVTQPTADERKQLIAWINESVVHADWKEFADPGRVSLARLTKLEFRNAVRDVFSVDVQAGSLLSNDPEGSTGFTNDRESLSFPLFAFDDFLREAERAAETMLGFAEPRWTWTREFEELARTSTITSEATTEGDGIILKNANEPFFFTFEVPHAGLYEVVMTARTLNGQPLSGLGLFLDGASVQEWLIEGTDTREYRTRLNLAAGAHTLNFGYNAALAPILQPKQPPQIVPERVAKQVSKKSVPKVELPAKLNGNRDAFESFRRLNNVMAAYKLTQELAELLIARGETDYEQHELHKQHNGLLQNPVMNNFQTSKVPFNLAAGKVAVLLGMPQKDLEQRLKKEHGFSHDAYVQTVKAYNEAFAKKHPERVRKKAGQVALDRIELRNHAVAPGETQPNWLLAGLTSEANAGRVLDELGHRACSRPLRAEERAALLGIYQKTFAETKSRREALRDAIAGLLVSPPFLLRYAEGPASAAFEVNQIELARRLSHFFWLSIPDAGLRELAAAGKLSDGATLAAQLDRMVADERFDDFARAFTTQWLDLSNLDNQEKLGADLRGLMRDEAAHFVRDLFRENRSVLDLVDARYAYVNARLADHYDLPAVSGHELRRVELKTDQRGGLLAMGAMLASTSTAERTSPVNRGAWIVELLLGKHLPPPPPSVPELKTDNQARTVREELEQHRSNPACAGCHAKIDPYGFVLEHYDPTGAWRERDKGKPVNASTVLDDGATVNGLPEFRRYVLDRRAEDLTRNVISRLLAFALGRELRFTDEATVLELMEQAKRDGYQARTLLHRLVQSAPFREQNNSTPTEP